jgi:hypothetical protein
LIFRIYTSAPQISIRREAAWVLRRRAEPSNWHALFDAFHVDELPQHRQCACELAEMFSDPDILPALSPLASDVDDHVRKAALKVIRGLSNRERSPSSWRQNFQSHDPLHAVALRAAVAQYCRLRSCRTCQSRR